MKKRGIFLFILIIAVILIFFLLQNNKKQAVPIEEKKTAETTNNVSYNENSQKNESVVQKIAECGSFLSNENIMFGYPSKEHVLERQAYVVSHDDNKKIPLWVSYHLTAEYLKANATRSDKFKADPDILKGKRAELEDYKGSGYDRGHIAPSADMLRSQSINDESFYLSNMCPQEPSFNRGIWENLEEQVRKWAANRKSVWVIAGPITTHSDKTIGMNKVDAPKGFFKIVVSRDNCNFDTIAFEFSSQKADTPLESYIVSIGKIENDTNLDFLNVLEDDLEEKIESIPAKELWS